MRTFPIPEVNECKTQPCHAQNTASCEDRRLERVCHCKEGFMGGEIKGRPPAAPFDDCSRADSKFDLHFFYLGMGGGHLA